MYYFGICVLLLIFNVTFSENICKNPQNSCECILPDDKIIDLSSVGLIGKPRFIDILYNANCSEVYSYNPCFAFDFPDRYVFTGTGNKPCFRAAACVKGFGGINGSLPEEHAIGLQKSAIFGKNKDQIYINYTVPESEKVLQVNLKCQNDTPPDQAELIMDEESKCSDTSDIIVLTLSSKCACPDGCPKVYPKDDSSSDLSTGSKLLIAFFTILLAYMIIGIVWNYCNGAQGMELVPNIQFWNDLPTLIMEGVVFTCSCCGRQRSYGEV